MRAPSRSWRAMRRPLARHGPYLYRFYYRDRKRHSEYISLKKARALGLERPPVPRYGAVGSVVSLSDFIHPSARSCT
jgi:hypothetical protein